MAWSVVILGGGFGGLYAARKLERSLPAHAAKVTVVTDVKLHAVHAAPARGGRRNARSAPRGRPAARARGGVGIRWRGFLAWFLARTYHLAMMPGIKRQVRLLVDWTVDLLFDRDTSELGQLGHPPALEVDAGGGAARQTVPR